MILPIADIKTSILKLDQVELFSYYLNIDTSEIYSCLGDSRISICNPLRIDNNPSLTFIEDVSGGEYKVRMFDRANILYRGDIFDLVGILFNLHSNFNQDFCRICQQIMNDIHVRKEPKRVKSLATSKHVNKILITTRAWNNTDAKIWSNLFTESELNAAHVFPVRNGWIFSDICNYSYTSGDPCYAYYLDTYNDIPLYKLYFPKRSKGGSKPRFITNNSIYPIEAICELEPAEVLIITKARKEKLLIKKLLPRITTNLKIEVTNLIGESLILKKEFMDKLFSVYPYIFFNLDYDRAGIMSALEYKRIHGVETLFIPNGKFGTIDVGGKDLGEIRVNCGVNATLALMQEANEYIQTFIKNLKDESMY